MNPLPRILLALTLLASTPGCATMKRFHEKGQGRPKPVAARAVPGPLRIGTVTLVNERDHFVLIDTGMAPAPPVGTALKTFTSEAESGVVAVGDVQRRPFFVADIVQGAPKKDDAVFQ